MMEGIHTALVTPFTAGGSVDVDAFEALCERQIEAGVQGIVACGTTGEATTLTAEEWRQVVGAAVRVSAKRVTVSAGVGTNDTAHTVHNVEAALELGADVGLLVFPYYNKPNPAGHRAHVRAAASPGLPLMLYHVPGRTAQVLPVDLFAALSEIEGVVAVKEATGDVRYGTDLLARTKVAVLSGDDFTFLGLLAQGATGCVSVLSNVAPAETVGVWRAHRDGRPQEAIARLRRLWDLLTFLFSESSPVPCKAALASIGLCRPDARLPLATFAGPSPGALVERSLGWP
jgi:4-hydroxy-tetrahydrodipicolinate synthase